MKNLIEFQIIVAFRRSDLTFEKLVTRIVLKHPKKLSFENECNYFDVKLCNSVILNAIITNGSTTQQARGV